MAEAHEGNELAANDHERVVRRLEALGWRAETVERIGLKAATAAKMARGGLPVPDSWVLDRRWFDEFLARSLPRNHDLRTLIRLAGSATGEERCARAYEELLTAPLPNELVLAIEGWWRALAPRPERGIAVRPSLAGPSERARAATRHMHSLVVADDARSVVAAIRQMWASAVLSCAVEVYSESGLREAALATLLQRAVPVDMVAWLTRMTGARGPASEHGWHLGTVVDALQGATRKALILAPLELDKGSAVPEVLAPLYEALEPSGFELVVQMAAAAEKELGPNAIVCFSLDRSEGRRLHVLGADESPRWRMRGSDDETAWLEVLLASDGDAPPRRLGQSLLARVTKRGVGAALRSVGGKLDGDARVVAGFSGRTYVSLSAVCEAAHELPVAMPEDVLHATGAASAELAERVASRAPARGKNLIREAIASSTLLRRQVRLHREVTDVERQLQREARAIAEMDLTLLPTDGLSTTLVAAQGLLERTVELWSQIATSQGVHQVALSALLRRRVLKAPALTSAIAMSGIGGSFGPSLVLAFARVVDVFRADQDAQTRLREEIATARELPDGPARGALGQFLTSYGDVARGPFELARPRWREDAREVFAMIRLWLARPGAGKGRVEAAQERVRAAADAELVRFEPDLAVAERSMARLIIDSGRAMARARAGIDRLVYRTLAVLRDVVLDVNRRLLRIDPSCPSDGAFDCSLERLVASFKSGRPELRRVIAMRQVEQALARTAPAPPLSFVGSPPRVATPLRQGRGAVSGIGVAPGVVDGRAQLVSRGIPERVVGDEILIVPSLDVALAPLYVLAAGVISESGGMLAPAAEAVRELGISAVASLEDAGLFLCHGERLRIDGERGVVQRLDHVSTP